MKYSEYIGMVDNLYPGINLGRQHVSPPEALKIVAVACFMEDDQVSEVAKETLNQLHHLNEMGTTTFDKVETMESAAGTKSGYGRSEFI